MHCGWCWFNFNKINFIENYLFPYHNILAKFNTISIQSYRKFFHYLLSFSWWFPQKWLRNPISRKSKHWYWKYQSTDIFNIKALILKISKHSYWTLSYFNSSYQNIDIKNIEPPNHIEPKSLKCHIEPALILGYSLTRCICAWLTRKSFILGQIVIFLHVIIPIIWNTQAEVHLSE